jgi:hypothetical protein
MDLYFSSEANDNDRVTSKVTINISNLLAAMPTNCLLPPFGLSLVNGHLLPMIAPSTSTAVVLVRAMTGLILVPLASAAAKG